MARWLMQICDAPWSRTVDAEYIGIEYGVLVFRESPNGNVLLSYAAGYWKSVERVIDVVVTPDLFGNATREIVQG